MTWPPGYAKGKVSCDAVPSLLYSEARDLGLSEAQLRDIQVVLADVCAPAPYTGEEDRRHPVTVTCGIRDLDKTFGPLYGFVEIKENVFTCGLLLLARYAGAAHRAGFRTLFITPSRAKVTYFAELTTSWSVSINSAVVTTLPELLHVLLQVQRGSIGGELVLLDGVSILALGCAGIGSEGRDDYLLTLLELIKSLSESHTVLVEVKQALVTASSEGRVLGLSAWSEQTTRSLTLKSLSPHRYLLKEVTDRLTAAHFDLS